MGMAVVRSSALSRRTNSHPSMLGKIRSVTITSGRDSQARVNPSIPLRAVKTLNPLMLRYSAYRSRVSWWSSTIRTTGRRDDSINLLIAKSKRQNPFGSRQILRSQQVRGNRSTDDKFRYLRTIDYLSNFASFPGLSRNIRKESGKGISDNLIAFAGGFFQAFSVNDRDFFRTVVDHTCLVKRP